MIKLLLPFILLFSSQLRAQDIIPGLIPRFYSIEAATDLPMSPEEAHEAALNGVDLSLLGPSQDTNIWGPHRKTIPDIELIRSGESVRFVKELPARSGQVRFTVLTQDGRELVMVLSKKAHTILLRRNLLAKVGYNSQPMSWVPKVRLEFKDTIDRDLLKEEMKDKLLAASERWVRSEEGLNLELQDALVLSSESEIYNLATGIMMPEIHQGRRILRAPYVALALVDASESVNLMPWQAGRVVLNHLKLNHTLDLSTTYGTSWEDARWIGRRIGQLERMDIEEIVAKAHFPSAVKTLLVEKIAARRNDLMALLDLEEETVKLPFDPEVSEGEALVNGEITQEFFEGHAARFSYGDPESPFSASELGQFALSRAQSEALNMGLTQLNKFLGTQDQQNYIERIGAIVKKEGPFFSTQALAIPTFHGALILSRDIITGPYLGTNNKVQLVDNIGFALDAGVFGGIEGLPIPVDLKGGGGVSFSRVYSHVKPVESLKKSMKEPYKNLLIPLLLRNLAQKIDMLKGASGEQNEALLQQVAAELKGSLAIGESFIITDSLIPRIFAEAVTSVTQYFFLDKRLLQIYARVQSEALIMARFHLFRADENTFHVYQDKGKNLKLSVTIKLRSYIPIISINGRWSKASAETRMYPISLHPRDVSAGVLKGLRQGLLSLTHSGLDEVLTPHKIEHKMKGAASTLQFLIFKRNRIGSEQNLVLTHQKGGEKKEIHRRYDAITSGTDYEGHAVEAANLLISQLLKSDVSLSQVQTINPGLTLGGKAKNRIFTTEMEGDRLTTTFQRVFNGWRVRPTRMKKILATINREAGRTSFGPLTVSNTDSILLYQISFLYTLTQEGSERLLNVTWELLWDLINRHQIGNVMVNFKTNRHFNRIQRVKKIIEGEDPGEGPKEWHKLLKELQEDMSIMGLEELVGKENLAYQGKIEGFRQGDEAGDTPIFSHVFGELPLALHPTPTQKVMQNWGILEGEILANWMMERAI
jgi:hypothetical protein